MTDLANKLNDAQVWFPGGTYCQITTAITADVGGNITGTASEFVQGVAVNYLQSLAAHDLKQMVASLGDDQEPVRAALHGQQFPPTSSTPQHGIHTIQSRAQHSLALSASLASTDETWMSRSERVAWSRRAKQA